MPFFTVDPDPSVCVVSYSYKLIDDTGAEITCNCFDPVTLTLDYYFDTDLLASGAAFRDYTVEVTGTTGVNTQVTQVASYNLQLKNPCIDPAFV